MAAPVEPRTAQDAGAVTKSDTTIYAPMFDALYVGGAGTVTIRTARGSSVAFEVVAGGYISCAGDKVLSTGTDATDIVWLRY